MYINKIKLINEAGIFNGMQLETIEIEFDDRTLINLICGTNGSGKSTILNNLNPFFLGNIREGKIGYKYISYTKKHSKINITHKATPTKTGHTVKSYIVKIKNGEEYDLNPNGNQATFLEAVEEELGITPSKLKLLNLGTEISSIVEMTPSIRKNFISIFTQDAEIYLNLLKTVNNKARVLEDLLFNTTSALKSLGSREEIESIIKGIDINLADGNEKYENTIQNISKFELEYDNINKKYTEAKQYEKIKNELLSINIPNMTIEDMNLQVLEFKTKEINFSIEKNQYVLETDKINIDKLEKEISELRNNYSELTLQLNILEDKSNSIASLDEIASYNETVKSYENIMDRIQKKYDKYNHLAHHKENLELLRNQYSIYRNKITALQEVGIASTLDVQNLPTDKIENLLKEKRKSLSETSKKVTENRTTLENLKERLSEYESFELPSNKCLEFKCTLVQRFTDNSNIDKKIAFYEKILTKLLSEEKVLECDIIFLDNIYKILIENDKFKAVLDSISNELKSELKININNVISISGFDKVQDIINDIVMYNHYNDIKQKIEEFNTNNEETINLKKKCSDILDDIHSKEEELDIYNNQFKEVSSEFEKNKKELENINNAIESIKSIVGEGDLNEIIKKADKVIEYQSVLVSLSERLDIEKDKRYEIQNFIKAKEIEREKYLYNLKAIRQYLKQKELLDEYYVDMKYLRDALGTKKGIPMVMINSFLQKVKYFANEIIKDAFDGELSIVDFIVEPNEFRIPLKKKNGEELKDISKASSGERAIAKLAISLAIFKQIKIKYNIIGLDELDGPLDTGKRRKFIKLFMSKMEELGIDQVFNITHNNLFNDVDANLILLKGANADEFLTSNRTKILFKF